MHKCVMNQMGSSLGDLVSAQSEVAIQTRIIAHQLLMWMVNDEILAEKMTNKTIESLQQNKPISDHILLAVFLFYRQHGAPPSQEIASPAANELKEQGMSALVDISCH